MGQFFQVNGDYNIKTKDGATITLDPGASGNVYVAGNLNVAGTTTTIDTTNLQIEDNIILLNKGETNTFVSEVYSGLEIDRGGSARAAFVWDDTDPTGITGSTGKWIIASGTAGSYSYTDSNLQVKRILTKSSEDDGDLTLIGTGTGVVKVKGTSNYRLQVTDNDDIPNKDYVDYSILNNPTFQIRAPQSEDTRVIIADKDITPNSSSQSGSLAYFTNETGFSTGGDSAVSMIVDGSLTAQFFKTRVVIQGLEISDTEITNDDTNSNVFIRTNGTGKLQTNYAFQLDNTIVTPASTTGSNVVYAKSESTGKSGLFFVNNEGTRDELVSKNRALLFSMLF